MKSKLPFNLKPNNKYGSVPIWNGKNFVIDNTKINVLEYSENFSGWSDDLTFLHENALGDAHPIDVASRKYALHQIKKSICGETAVILEVGCSSGFMIKELIKNFPKFIILGADVVKEPLYKLSSEVRGVPLFRFDLLKCPLPDNSIDVLIMLNVLEHIDDDQKAIQKAYHLVKPGGHLIVEVPACPSLFDSYDKELLHFRRYKLSELENKLTNVGFVVKKKSHLGFLLFPFFSTVKLINRIFFSRNVKPVVKRRASATSSNFIVSFITRFESMYMSEMSLPIGIRAVINAKKL